MLGAGDASDVHPHTQLVALIQQHLQNFANERTVQVILWKY